MNKSDFVDAIALDAALSKVTAEKALDSIMSNITVSLGTGESVQLPIGTFSRVLRAARKGRNPQTGEEIDIPEKLAVKFKASKKFKEDMQEGIETPNE